jgi:hypothetical protein
MRRCVRNTVVSLLMVAGLGAAVLAVARPPAQGVVGGTWDIVDTAGQVVGRLDMDCDGNVYTWGVQNGRFVTVSSYPCPRQPGAW